MALIIFIHCLVISKNVFLEYKKKFIHFEVLVYYHVSNIFFSNVALKTKPNECCFVIFVFFTSASSKSALDKRTFSNIVDCDSTIPKVLPKKLLGHSTTSILNSLQYTLCICSGTPESDTRPKYHLT